MYPSSRQPVPRQWRRPRHHAGEGIEDGVNVVGVFMFLLGILALALTLVAAGYGFAGWATVAGIACGLLFVGAVAVISLEWHRQHADDGPEPEERQGH